MKKTTLIFIMLSGIASFLNYATYPALARILSDEQFVNIAIALALFTQLSSFTLSIVALTIGISKENNSDSKIIIEKLQAVLSHLFFIVVISLLIISPILLKKIHLPASLLVPIFAMLALSISMSIITGYLNGKQKLVKLGITIACSALLQFIFSVSFGLLTKSGAVALNAMALGSFVAIIATYHAYSDEGLPQISTIFLHRFKLYRSQKMQKLIKYTILSSLAVLIANILLIIDLLIVNNRQIDSKLYTDMYVISRIVFFSGMLFVWPFLSNIDIRYPRHNILLLLKLIVLFTAITIGAVIVMLFYSENVAQILLGSSYNTESNIKVVAVLAIFYKFIYLIILSLILFFIVMRSYWAVVVPLSLIVATLGAILVTGPNASTTTLVTALNISSAIGLLLGLYGFIKISIKPLAIK